MTKEQARHILGLSEIFSREELDTAYRRQRDVYYPPMHELFAKGDEAHIKEQMYEQMTAYTYSYPLQNPQAGSSGSEKAQYAFMRFADICDAYHILLDDKNYTPYRLDGDDPDWYWTVRYGKANAALRRTAANFSRKTLWLLIPLLVAWIAALAAESLAIGMIATAVFIGLHWGIPFLLTPVDFLLYIPKGLWSGIKFGAEYGLLITKLYSIIFCGAGYLIWWTIKFIFRPCLILDDWEIDMSDKRDYTRRCKKLVPLRYERTKEQVAAFGREYMGDKVQKARSAYLTMHKWDPHARDAALREVEPIVKAQNPQYEANICQARSDAGDLRFFEAQLRHDSERASKWIDWVATDTYGSGPFVFSNYDEDLADSMYERHAEKTSASYSFLDQQRMHFALQAEIARQRQLLECCVVLHSMM